MKLQGLGIILALILIPIILVLSYYIQGQVNTITMQTAYDAKLLDATHDAMSAFEINTANENLSSVADSLRSIIQASNNIFLNTFSTNLGMSNANKSVIQPFLPGILYTLYDGYYIYTPTKVPVVATYLEAEGSKDELGNLEVDMSGHPILITDRGGQARYTLDGDLYYIADDSASSVEYIDIYRYENGTITPEQIAVTLDTRDAKYKTDYVLKSYIPYSARYSDIGRGGVTDVTINYTLDNYITIMGDIGDIYYTKSGYLINPATVKEIKGFDEWGNDISIKRYNDLEAEEMCLSGRYSIIVTMENGANDITIGTAVRRDVDGNIVSVKTMEEQLLKLYEYWHYSNIHGVPPPTSLTEDAFGNPITNTTLLLDSIQYYEHEIEMARATAYYVKSYIFSTWVYSNLNLGDVQEGDIQETYSDEMKKLYKTKDNESVVYDFSPSNPNNTRKIFDISVDGLNPEEPDSIFSRHKREVIKNSIQYNLNLAMSSYNYMSQNSNSFNMPVIRETEWDKILNNISIVSFMQGFKCGFKTYNNYAIVSSTNNELTAIPEEVYYVRANEFNDENGIYHRIDCPDLFAVSEDTASPVVSIDTISFRSKEVKYDKIFNKSEAYYEYDHKNLACYRCIVGSSFARYEASAGYGGSEGRYGNMKELEDEIPALTESQLIEKERGVGKGIDVERLSYARKKAYYIGVGSARQSLYRTNALKESQGYEIVLDSPIINRNFTPDGTIMMTRNPSRTIEEIKEIQITISNTKYPTDNSISIAKFNIRYGGLDLGDYTINLHQSKPQTIYAPVTKPFINSGVSGGITQIINFYRIPPPPDEITFTVESIKVIYK